MPTEQNRTIAAKLVRDEVAGTFYRDADGWPWEPMPGENPRAGGKIRVRGIDESKYPVKRTGTYLNGVITVDDAK